MNLVSQPLQRHVKFLQLGLDQLFVDVFELGAQKLAHFADEPLAHLEHPLIATRKMLLGELILG